MWREVKDLEQLEFSMVSSLGDGRLHKAEQCNRDIRGNNDILLCRKINFCFVKLLYKIFVDLQCRSTHVRVEYDYDVQDYFNEVDEATDCEEPRAKTVNLYRWT